MRLAVFTNRYPARVATFFERDMRALLKAGIDMDVFTIHPLDAADWAYSSELIEAGLPKDRVHHLTLGASLRRGAATLMRQPGRCLKDAARALTAAARFGPVPFSKTAYVLPQAWSWAAKHADQYDHVLAYWGNYAGTCAYVFHRLQRRPVPFTMWLHAGVDLYRDPVFLPQKIAYADNIVTCCEFNREFIRKSFATKDPSILAKLHVCHHGLDLAQFPFEVNGRTPRRVVAVGRIVPQKGFEHLVQAAQILHARGVDVTVEFVGDGEGSKALQKFAADLGVADRVHFRGWLPFPEVRRAMSAAAILIQPSEGLGDGLPNVVREAMALGTPVIASRVAGIPDALSDGCGVLVPPGNTPALADAIEALLDAPELRGDIAARARRRVEERYDLWRNGAFLAGLLRGSTRRADPAPLTAWRTTHVRQENA